ncbi:hypothetical protein [Mycolicibacterium vinylchloridicum]|uniref:hypothetical protein n=1 Tax=Mycolicibacterium vinylchloridicum TaxID=2736928 RepID=UPI0015CC937F|nr:hypothetical protein [Mycolicibacterium vinylchloridicum]
MSTHLDHFWANVDAALDRCAAAATVADIITILNEHFEPEGGNVDAFFGGSGGDTQLLDKLYWERRNRTWQIVRYDAPYYWCLADINGDLLTYIEGDVYRGNTMTD